VAGWWLRPHSAPEKQKLTSDSIGPPDVGQESASHGRRAEHRRVRTADQLGPIRQAGAIAQPAGLHSVQRRCGRPKSLKQFGGQRSTVVQAAVRDAGQDHFLDEAGVAVGIGNLHHGNVRRRRGPQGRRPESLRSWQLAARLEMLEAVLKQRSREERGA
jgi:hypothetical protein